MSNPKIFVKKKDILQKIGGYLLTTTFLFCFFSVNCYAVDLPQEETTIQEETVVEETVVEETVVEETIKKEMSEEQVREIVDTALEENKQGHLNEEEVLKIVDDNLQQSKEQDLVINIIDENEDNNVDNGVMLLIEYVADTSFVISTGEVYYLPSTILSQYNYVLINPTYGTAYFYNEYYHAQDGLTFIGRSSSDDDTISGYIICKLKDVNIGDSVTATIYESVGQIAMSILRSSYISHDVYEGSHLIKASNGVIGATVLYSVEFSTGYDDILIEQITANENGLIEALPVPTIAPNGFSFEGWYLDELYNTKVDENYIFISNTTLYAKWVEVNSVSDYSEQIETVAYLLQYIIGFIVFFVIVILCKYIYSFLNIFF